MTVGRNRPLTARCNRAKIRMSGAKSLLLYYINPIGNKVIHFSRVGIYVRNRQVRPKSPSNLLPSKVYQLFDKACNSPVVSIMPQHIAFSRFLSIFGIFHYGNFPLSEFDCSSNLESVIYRNLPFLSMLCRVPEPILGYGDIIFA